MGFNTGVLILNDRLHDIEQNALSFTASLCVAVREFHASKNHDVFFGSARVFHVAHADSHDSYTIGGNLAQPMTFEQLTREARLFGYRLVEMRG
jgi:hypothetical protein